MGRRHRALVILCFMLQTCFAPVGAAEMPIKCTADFSLLGMGDIAVEIVPSAEGTLQARINGVISNEKVSVDDSRPRSGLDLKVSPYSKEFSQLNSGEKSLVHLQRLLDNPEFGHAFKIPFDPSSVRRLLTYDLIGRTDKFGGRVLLEAYGSEGQLLGRVLRAALASSCI